MAWAWKTSQYSFNGGADGHPHQDPDEQAYCCPLQVCTPLHLTIHSHSPQPHSDGVGRTGTFITMHSELERLKAEGEVDVFQRVKICRIARPGLVQNVVRNGDLLPFQQWVTCFLITLIFHSFFIWTYQPSPSLLLPFSFPPPPPLFPPLGSICLLSWVSCSKCSPICCQSWKDFLKTIMHIFISAHGLLFIRWLYILRQYA